MILVSLGTSVFLNSLAFPRAASHDSYFAYTGRSASGTAFPRGAWERG